MAVSNPLDHIRADTELIVAAAHQGLDAPVPSCPDWTLRDLIVHLGHVQRWAAELVGRAPDDLPEFGTDTPPAGPDIASWLAEGAEQLVHALAATDRGKPVWTFAGIGTVEFWERRQVHETALHRWDAEATHGEGGEIVLEVATDGLDEKLDSAASRTFDSETLGAPTATVQLIATDHDLDTHPGLWRVSLGSDGASWAPEEHDSDVTLAASAEGLLLAVQDRIKVDELEIQGRGDLFELWVAAIVA